MIRSRLDLYKKPGDEAVDEDPAYQDYPDVSLQPNVKASSFKPSEEPTIDKLRDELPDFLKPFYGEPGGLNLATGFQILGGALSPGQEVLTPEDDKNLIGVQLENAMAKKAGERIRPEVEALGKPARFTEPEIARRVYEDIGGREFSRPKAFLQEIQTPIAESVRDLAEGRPIYDFSPVELTDLIFSAIDQIDVALGTKGIVGGTAKAIRAGLSAGTRALLDALERAPSKAAQEEIVRRDPKNALQLKQELDLQQIKMQERGTTQDLTSDYLEETLGFPLDDPELNRVRFATGEPVRPTGKGGQSREYIDYRNSQTNKLIDIIEKNKKSDQGLSLNELIAKYDIQDLLILVCQAHFYQTVLVCHIWQLIHLEINPDQIFYFFL